MDVDELVRMMRETRSGFVPLRSSVPDGGAGEARAPGQAVVKESLWCSAAILLVFPVWVLMVSIVLPVRRPTGVIA